LNQAEGSEKCAIQALATACGSGMFMCASI
jgi:hypothetical protein